MTRLDGSEEDLSLYKGKVVMLVNVASKCGLTPQYKGLQTLYDRYGPKGLVILGFPGTTSWARNRAPTKRSASSAN